MNDKILIGVIGAGHLGRYHIKKLLAMKNVSFSGFYDVSLQRSIEIAKEFNIISYKSIEELLNFCDAVTIAAPTTRHFECSRLALENNCHIFVEKPFTNSISKASKLVSMAEERELFIQVGHIEQFNPAFLAVKSMDIHPDFIEAHRLSPFPGRGFDVPVVLDLMIHDIGILLTLVKSQVKSIHAFGQCVVSDTIDLANVRIEFDNGCVANLTASRVALKKMRKMRLFQHHRYLTIDFMNHIVEDYIAFDQHPDIPDSDNVFHIDGPNEKYVWYNNIDIESQDALELELKHFIQAIKLNHHSGYSGKKAAEALKLAIRIQNKIEKNLSQFA